MIFDIQKEIIGFAKIILKEAGIDSYSLDLAPLIGSKGDALRQWLKTELEKNGGCGTGALIDVGYKKFFADDIFKIITAKIKNE